MPGKKKGVRNAPAQGGAGNGSELSGTDALIEQLQRTHADVIGSGEGKASGDGGMINVPLNDGPADNSAPIQAPAPAKAKAEAKEAEVQKAKKAKKAKKDKKAQAQAQAQVNGSAETSPSTSGSSKLLPQRAGQVNVNLNQIHQSWAKVAGETKKNLKAYLNALLTKSSRQEAVFILFSTELTKLSPALQTEIEILRRVVLARGYTIEKVTNPSAVAKAKAEIIIALEFFLEEKVCPLYQVGDVFTRIRREWSAGISESRMAVFGEGSELKRIVEVAEAAFLTAQKNTLQCLKELGFTAISQEEVLSACTAAWVTNKGGDDEILAALTSPLNIAICFTLLQSGSPGQMGLLGNLRIKIEADTKSSLSSLKPTFTEGLLFWLAKIDTSAQLSEIRTIQTMGHSLDPLTLSHFLNGNPLVSGVKCTDINPTALAALAIAFTPGTLRTPGSEESKTEATTEPQQGAGAGSAALGSIFIPNQPLSGNALVTALTRAEIDWSPAAVGSTSPTSLISWVRDGEHAAVLLEKLTSASQRARARASSTDHTARSRSVSQTSQSPVPLRTLQSLFGLKSSSAVGAAAGEAVDEPLPSGGASGGVGIPASSAPSSIFTITAESCHAAQIQLLKALPGDLEKSEALIEVIKNAAVTAGTDHDLLQAALQAPVLNKHKLQLLQTCGATYADAPINAQQVRAPRALMAKNPETYIGKLLAIAKLPKDDRGLHDYLKSAAVQKHFKNWTEVATLADYDASLDPADYSDKITSVDELRQALEFIAMHPLADQSTAERQLSLLNALTPKVVNTSQGRQVVVDVIVGRQGAAEDIQQVLSNTELDATLRARCAILVADVSAVATLVDKEDQLATAQDRIVDSTHLVQLLQSAAAHPSLQAALLQRVRAELPQGAVDAGEVAVGQVGEISAATLAYFSLALRSIQKPVSIDNVSERTTDLIRVIDEMRSQVDEFKRNMNSGMSSLSGGEDLALRATTALLVSLATTDRVLKLERTHLTLFKDSLESSEILPEERLRRVQEAQANVLSAIETLLWPIETRGGALIDVINSAAAAANTGPDLLRVALGSAWLKNQSVSERRQVLNGCWQAYCVGPNRSVDYFLELSQTAGFTPKQLQEILLSTPEIGLALVQDAAALQKLCRAIPLPSIADPRDPVYSISVRLELMRAKCDCIKTNREFCEMLALLPDDETRRLFVKEWFEDSKTTADQGSVFANVDHLTSALSQFSDSEVRRQCVMGTRHLQNLISTWDEFKAVVALAPKLNPLDFVNNATPPVCRLVSSAIELQAALEHMVSERLDVAPFERCRTLIQQLSFRMERDSLNKATLEKLPLSVQAYLAVSHDAWMMDEALTQSTIGQVPVEHWLPLVKSVEHCISIATLLLRVNCVLSVRKLLLEFAKTPTMGYTGWLRLAGLLTALQVTLEFSREYYVVLADFLDLTSAVDNYRKRYQSDVPAMILERKDLITQVNQLIDLAKTHAPIFQKPQDLLEYGHCIIGAASPFKALKELLQWATTAEANTFNANLLLQLIAQCRQDSRAVASLACQQWLEVGGIVPEVDLMAVVGHWQDIEDLMKGLLALSNNQNGNPGQMAEFATRGLQYLKDNNALSSFGLGQQLALLQLLGGIAADALPSNPDHVQRVLAVLSEPADLCALIHTVERCISWAQLAGIDGYAAQFEGEGFKTMLRALATPDDFQQLLNATTSAETQLQYLRHWVLDLRREIPFFGLAEQKSMLWALASVRAPGGIRSEPNQEAKGMESDRGLSSEVALAEPTANTDISLATSVAGGADGGLLTCAGQLKAVLPVLDASRQLALVVEGQQWISWTQLSAIAGYQSAYAGDGYRNVLRAFQGMDDLLALLHEEGDAKRQLAYVMHWVGKAPKGLARDRSYAELQKVVDCFEGAEQLEHLRNEMDGKCAGTDEEALAFSRAVTAKVRKLKPDAFSPRVSEGDAALASLGVVGVMFPQPVVPVQVDFSATAAANPAQ